MLPWIKAKEIMAISKWDKEAMRRARMYYWIVLLPGSENHLEYL
jgi:hypothetical protein